MSSERPAFSRKRAPNSALAASSRDDEVLELVGLDQHEVGAGRLVGVGEVDDDAVVGPDRVGLEAVARRGSARSARAPTRRGRARRTGVSTHRRQSPISSRKRSMTIVRSLTG